MIELKVKRDGMYVKHGFPAQNITFGVCQSSTQPEPSQQIQKILFKVLYDHTRPRST